MKKIGLVVATISRNRKAPHPARAIDRSDPLALTNHHHFGVLHRDVGHGLLEKSERQSRSENEEHRFRATLQDRDCRRTKKIVKGEYAAPCLATFLRQL